MAIFSSTGDIDVFILGLLFINIKVKNKENIQYIIELSNLDNEESINNETFNISHRINRLHIKTNSGMWNRLYWITQLPVATIN